jgi:hypothetical protein
MAAWQVVCLAKALLFLFFWTVSFISCYKAIINLSYPSWVMRWLQDRMT